MEINYVYSINVISVFLPRLCKIICSLFIGPCCVYICLGTLWLQR